MSWLVKTVDNLTYKLLILHVEFKVDSMRIVCTVAHSDTIWKDPVADL